MNEFAQWLQQRLLQPLPGYEAQQKMMSMRRPRVTEAPPDARESGVLIVLYPQQEEIYTVLIERTKDGGVHSGQIALPGGRREADDIDIIQTALREANEEVALDDNTVKVLGQLTELYIPVSNFLVQPIIAFANEKPTLVASEAEVAQILHCPLQRLFANKQEVDVIASSSVTFKVHTVAYVPEVGLIMWGATAMIFSELEHLWNEYKLEIDV